MAIPGNLLSVTTESVDPNTSGWRARLNCFKGLGSGGRNGAGVLGLTSTAAGEMQAETVTAYPVTSGETYQVFADASASAQPERIGIEWLDGSLTPVGSITWSMTTASASASWHRVSVAGVCPLGATRARVVLSSSPAAAGVVHYWENVYFGLPIRTQGNLLPFQVESGGELDTSGWVAESNATVARVAPAQAWPVDWYLSGGHLMTLTAIAAGDASMRCTEPVPAAEGVDYRGYAYLGTTASGQQPWIELRFYDEGGAPLLTQRAVLAPLGAGLYRQYVSGVAPAGTRWAEVAVGLTGAAAGQVLRTEGVVVTPAPPLRAGTVVPYEDASFEQGVGAWTVASGSATISRTSPWTFDTGLGSYHLSVVSAAAGTTVLRSAAYPVEELVSWRPSYEARRIAGGWQVDLGLRWLDEAGVEIGTSGLAGPVGLPSDGNWWFIADDYTAPAGTTSARIEIALTATAASSTLYVDRVTLRQVLPQTEVLTDAGRAAATLILRELTAGLPTTVWRVAEDGQRTLVRGPDGLMDRVVVDSDLLALEDYEAPLGRPVTYYVEAYSTSTGAVAMVRTSDPVVIDPGDGNYVWLKDPGAPNRNLRLLVNTAPDWTRPIQAAEYRVRGRRNPVVLSDVRGGLEGTLAVWTESDAQRAALHRLLDSGATLLWQAAPGHGVDDLYVTVGEIGEARTGGTALDPWRAWSLPLVEADMPTAVGVAGTSGRSWQDVLSENATWQHLLDRYATWEDLWFGRQKEA